MIFCQAYCFNFQSYQNNFFVKHIVPVLSLIMTAFLSIHKNIVRLLTWHSEVNKPKALKKKICEELMPITPHPKRWWNLCLSENKKKEIKLIFTE